MKGLINTVVVMLGSAAMVGCSCEKYRQVVDPCYPERYQSMSRETVNQALAPQVQNGRALDQTIWNSHFESGTDKLTLGGQEHLAYLARRRPAPDTMVYVQTAQDISFDQAAPEKLFEARSSLDAKRMKAVKDYLQAYTAGRGLDFSVGLHDPSPVDGQAMPAATAVQRKNSATVGVLPTSGGSASGGGGAGGGTQ